MRAPMVVTGCFVCIHGVLLALVLPAVLLALTALGAKETAKGGVGLGGTQVEG